MSRDQDRRVKEKVCFTTTHPVALIQTKKSQRKTKQKKHEFCSNIKTGAPANERQIILTIKMFVRGEKKILWS